MDIKLCCWFYIRVADPNYLFRIRIFYFWIADPPRVFKLIKISKKNLKKIYLPY